MSKFIPSYSVCWNDHGYIVRLWVDIRSLANIANTRTFGDLVGIIVSLFEEFVVAVLAGLKTMLLSFIWELSYHNWSYKWRYIFCKLWIPSSYLHFLNIEVDFGGTIQLRQEWSFGIYNFSNFWGEIAWVVSALEWESSHIQSGFYS